MISGTVQSHRRFGSRMWIRQTHRDGWPRSSIRLAFRSGVRMETEFCFLARRHEEQSTIDWWVVSVASSQAPRPPERWGIRVLYKSLTPVQWLPGRIIGHISNSPNEEQVVDLLLDRGGSKLLKWRLPPPDFGNPPRGRPIGCLGREEDRVFGGRSKHRYLPRADRGRERYAGRAAQAAHFGLGGGHGPFDFPRRKPGRHLV